MQFSNYFWGSVLRVPNYLSHLTPYRTKTDQLTTMSLLGISNLVAQSRVSMFIYHVYSLRQCYLFSFNTSTHTL